MRLKSLTDLFIHELKDLYNAEIQLGAVLPRFARAATHPDLVSVFEAHTTETQNQIERLQEICSELGADPSGVKCHAMTGLIEEAEEVLNSDADPKVRDAALIATAQRIEHYEIAGYGCARAFAQRLGHPDLASMLQASLDEEEGSDRELNVLAAAEINEAAMA